MYGVEYECYFAGAPLREDLEAYSISLGLDSMVHFCGWVHDMSSFYRSLDVFLFASSADALGLVPLEVITSGTLQYVLLKIPVCLNIFLVNGMI